MYLIYFINTVFITNVKICCCTTQVHEYKLLEITYNSDITQAITRSNDTHISCFSNTFQEGQVSELENLEY